MTVYELLFGSGACLVFLVLLYFTLFGDWRIK